MLSPPSVQYRHFVTRSRTVQLVSAVVIALFAYPLHRWLNEQVAPAIGLDTQLIDALAADAQDMGWAVQVHGRAQTPLSCQPAALRRALWNLVENGIKFGERVDIGITDSADHITFTVRDHGPGLPADELEKVFEPFYRTEQSRNRETGGTGLGLAIARNLVARHGGSVNLANAPDGGLLATLDLPRQYRVS